MTKPMVTVNCSNCKKSAAIRVELIDKESNCSNCGWREIHNQDGTQEAALFQICSMCYQIISDKQFFSTGKCIFHSIVPEAFNQMKDITLDELRIMRMGLNSFIKECLAKGMDERAILLQHENLKKATDAKRKLTELINKREEKEGTMPRDYHEPKRLRVKRQRNRKNAERNAIEESVDIQSCADCSCEQPMQPCEACTNKTFRKYLN